MAYAQEWPYTPTNTPHYPAAATGVSEHILTSLHVCSPFAWVSSTIRGAVMTNYNF